MPARLWLAVTAVAAAIVVLLALPVIVPDRRTPSTLPIAAWGDSLTAGAGAGSTLSYPRLASAMFVPPRVVSVHGFGGETSTEVRTRMLAASAAERGEVTWIWVGRNNYDEPQIVLADIAQMVAALDHDRYLVGAIINGNYAVERAGTPGYAQLLALNARLKDTYGSRFVDLRAALIAAASPNDAEDVRADIVPRSLRYDNIHLNAAGYQVVATAMHDAAVRLGF